MPIPTSRDEFIEYCLRALGKPVIQINLDEDQIEDRVSEALYVYQQFHYDAVVQTYMQHEVTSSTLRFAANTTGTFTNNEVIVGVTSGTTGFATATVNAAAIKFYTTSATNNSATPADEYSDTARHTFVEGETILGRTSGATGVVGTSNSSFTAIVAGDMDNRWFPVSESVIGITKVFAPFDSRMSADILFDPQSQFNMSLLSNFTSNSIIPYVIGRQYQQLLNDTFRGRPGIRFSRHTNRLFVDVNWYTTFAPGQHIVLEGYRVINPDTYTDVWSDRWLQRYTIALLKQQWGGNLSKYGGIALPGGVTLDGRTILNEAKQEVRDLEAEVETKYQNPPMFIVG
tara:strand:+ start:40 stop:1068 length:1029 start_codon:yes stop_codon:yes gene_type:complete